MSAHVTAESEAPIAEGHTGGHLGVLKDSSSATEGISTALPVTGYDTAKPDAKPYTCAFSVDLGSECNAQMVKNTLSVDKELRPEDVIKTFKVSQSTLTIEFAATDARFLRSSVGAMCDLMRLAVRTLEMFGPATTAAEPNSTGPNSTGQNAAEPNAAH